MRTLRSVIIAVFLSAISAHAGPGIGPANCASAPAKLVTTTSAVNDWLVSGTIVNESKKPITAYRIAWAIVTDGSVRFVEGPWMNHPAGIQPGESVLAPAQNVKPQMQAKRFLFFVSKVKFADGTSWKANHDEVLKAGGAGLH